MKTASVWIHGRVARTLVRDELGNVIAMNDGWSNIASAQAAVMTSYLADLETARDTKRIKELNAEWDRNNK